MEVSLASWEECTTGIADLVEDHWRETDDYQEELVLNPDWDSYKFLMDNDMLFPFILLDDNKIIGYASFFRTPMLHFKGNSAAECDMLYIVPEYRTAKNAIQLLLFAEHFLKSYGVQYIQHTAKTKTLLGKFLSMLKYTPEEIKYGKYIGD